METISRDTLWSGHFLRAALVKYRDRKGAVRNWETVERINCGGVAVVVPITTNKEFLLVRQYRPVVDKHVVEFPAGLISEGEEPERAAFRELIEETGYFSEEILFLAEGPVSSGLSSEILTCFLALNARVATEELKRTYKPDESEDIEVIRTPMDSIYHTLENYRTHGDLIDLKIYGLIELARRRLTLK